MDHGSLRDEAVSRSGPFLDHPDHPDHFDPLDRLDCLNRLDDRSDHDHDPHTFAVSLLAAAAAATPHAPHPSGDCESGDPDDFYRSYRGVTEPSTTDNNSGNASPPVGHDAMAQAVSSSTRQLPPSLRSNGNGTTPKHPAVPPSHRGAFRSSQRSVSNPTDSRSPAGAAAGASRPSGTAEDRRGTAGGTPPSVKDLKKKFDQSPTHQSASGTRKSASRSSTTRDTTSSRLGARSPSASGGATSHGRTSRPASRARDTTRDTRRGSEARSSPRLKPAADAPHTGTSGNSSQSFASRLSRPRGAGSHPTSPSPSNKLSKKSMAPQSPTAPRQNGLLFGEILPEQSDSVTPGFGIEPARPSRRTSDSNLAESVRPHVRSFSDPDIEPPSPTDWYRAAGSAGQQQQQQQQAQPEQQPQQEKQEKHLRQNTGHQTSKIPKSQHARAQSDLATTKLTLSRPDYSAARYDVGSPISPISPTSPTSPTSRLPRMARRLNGATSGHASPASTRSNSPSTFNTKYSTASGRSSRQHHAPPGSRARTPTTASVPKTSSGRTPTSARKAPPSNISTSQQPTQAPSSRLNAYVSVPPAKLSPSLRSSRPRQSVATATTAASRMRAVEQGASAPKQSQRSAQKADETTPRRRKVSVGAIDFAQRRETIKLAYSKSIRETQAREVRRAAAEKRKEELAAAAKAKVEAEAATAAAMENARAAAAAAAANATKGPKKAESGNNRDGSARDSGSQLSEPASDHEVPRIEEPREIERDPPTPSQPPPEEFYNPPAPAEPLRLEIPGSFPNTESPFDEHDAAPFSAISMTSAITEFDTEIQTEPPRPENPQPTTDRSPSVVAWPNPVEVNDPQPEAVEDPPVQVATPVLRQRTSYQSPFSDEADDSVSIQISLDTSSVPHQQPSSEYELTPTRATFEPDTQPATAPAPAPTTEDDEYVPQPYTFSDKYETTVTILGPEPDFRPLSHQEPPRATVPQSHVPQSIEPSHASIPEMAASGTPQPVSTPRFGGSDVGSETLDRLEDFYTGPRLHDNIALLRDSTFTPSDPSTPLDGTPPASEYHKAPSEASHSLAVPGLLAPGNRTSQHSAWTDFTFASEDRNASQPNFASQPHQSETHRYEDGHDDHHDDDDDASFKVAPSAGDLSTCASSQDGITQSPESLSFVQSGAPPSPMIPELPAGQHHFPEFSSANTHSTRLGSEPERIASVTRRDPSLPPSSERVYERESTLYLAESRPESLAYSQDGGGPSGAVSPPQSISQLGLGEEPSQVSLGETLYDGQTPLTDKEQEEQKRLRQRQLVIRELIDTEDAFVRDMTVVEEIYKGTAEACPNLDNKTVKLIFRNTDEIIAFHAALLIEFKEGASTVYTPKGRRSPLPTPDIKDSDTATLNSLFSSNRPERNDEKDRLTLLGPVFAKNIEQLKAVHEVYLRSSDSSSKRLVQIQEDEAVMVWLSECNEVAKELTSAWNLDSLLIKPMQRITKYPDIITHLLKYTPEDHPDREALTNARTVVIDAIDEINKTKKNFELVGQIVSNRKRKESDVRAGLARAFGKRVDKLQVAATKTAEDEDYQKYQQQFGDDYLRLQVVLRDVEFYTRNITTYVHDFLQQLSSMELVMRLQPSRDYAHLESKWVQFNVSMRDIEKIALEKHLADVRKHVIEPFEQVIRCYGNPSLAMKKRAKRRLDYEKYMALKANGKKIDKQLAELVEQYEALNDTLKKELPKLSAMTAKIGNICLGKFISIQATWFSIWKEKVKAPLSDVAQVPEVSEIVSSFQREFALQEERAKALSIVNPTLKGRASQSTADDSSSILSKTRSRPSDILSSRGRGLSINSDHIPSLPTPDFAKRNSGQFSLSPASSALPSPANYYRDYYSGINNQGRATGAGSGSPVTPADPPPPSHNVSRPPPVSANLPPARPATGRSFDSTSLPRQSSDSATLPPAMISHRDSNSTFNSTSYPSQYTPGSTDQPATRRLSGLFNSAMPMPDGPEGSARSSRASSRDRSGAAANGYNVLWLAASLFEFNIETTKHEAGYPYLTYQAGEIFDVIAEKGELWLAKNQDDPRDVVGWIWSKHFAKLADS
ncbi:uncharacterized protein C8A04DRAFT_8746 [Dichotomopilus funicola]|uniref:DH domain-containing protein n=1 Tax=Dichotomopilus funicola TaxID=1934379 RepID=A0AAN6VBN2_9PEZI|nr:hypothetical protein C8A04DRAFT_8746 [Dichotomopilus funicola]